MNLENYITRNSLIDFVKKNSNIDLQKGGIPEHHAWCIGGKLPISISEYEFNFMKKFIIDNNLKNGFELGTGIGISTIAIAFGLGKNDGKLLTVDSYVEDETQYQFMGNKEIATKHGEKSKELLSKLFSLFNLKNIDQVIGWSPKYCIYHLKNRGKIDFVFLDCPKCDDDFLRDISYLPDFLSNKYVIFVHDSHTFTKKSDEHTKYVFGKELKRIHEFDCENGRIIQPFPLAVIDGLK